MGQSLQKLRGGSGAALQRGAKKAQPSRQSVEAPEPQRIIEPSPTTVRQSVEVRPEAPEPQRIIEPAPIAEEWDRRDPKYFAMTQQVVAKITTRPGGEQEMGSAHVIGEYRRPRPLNRHTSAATGPDEEKVVSAGTLNIVGIQEALRLKQDNKVDVKALAERFNVDAVLLERVFKYTSLPVPQNPRDPSNKLRA